MRNMTTTFIDASETKTPKRFFKSQRHLALWLLAVPLLLLLAAFLIATIVTAMGVMEKGSVRFYVGALSYSTLLAGFFMAPAYSIACVVFAVVTKGKDDLSVLKKRLLQFPFVMMLFLWCPTFLVSAEGKTQVLVLLIVATLFLVLPFVFCVRTIANRWSFA